MEPEVSVNDLIIIKTCDDYKVNDIVTYKKNKSYITHRINRIDGDLIYTKGDSNNTEDEAITKEQIQGKVCKIFKGIGKIINLKAMLILIAIFISINLIIRIKKMN